MPLSSAALTTLDVARAHLNVPNSDTSQNARIELLINAATQRIETITDRQLKERSHVEYRNGRRSNILLLRQWPVTSVHQVYVDQSNQFAETSLLDPSAYRISDEGNGVILLNQYFEQGYYNIKLVYTAGFNSTYHAGKLAELELACLWLVEWYYRHRERGDMGRVSKSKGDESVGILAAMPPMIKEILDDYKRMEFDLTDRANAGA
jgi:hypothetical protein